MLTRDLFSKTIQRVNKRDTIIYQTLKNGILLRGKGEEENDMKQLAVLYLRLGGIRHSMGGILYLQVGLELFTRTLMIFLAIKQKG